MSQSIFDPPPTAPTPGLNLGPAPNADPNAAPPAVDPRDEVLRRQDEELRRLRALEPIADALEKEPWRKTDLLRALAGNPNDSVPQRQQQYQAPSLYDQAGYAPAQNQPFGGDARANLARQDASFFESPTTASAQMMEQMLQRERQNTQQQLSDARYGTNLMVIEQFKSRMRSSDKWHARVLPKLEAKIAELSPQVLGSVSPGDLQTRLQQEYGIQRSTVLDDLEREMLAKNSNVIEFPRSAPPNMGNQTSPANLSNGDDQRQTKRSFDTDLLRRMKANGLISDEDIAEMETA